MIETCIFFNSGEVSLFSKLHFTAQYECNKYFEADTSNFTQKSYISKLDYRLKLIGNCLINVTFKII